MAFKSLDLQLSIPRTQDAGTLQGQMQHKPVADQQKLADDEAKRTELLRQRNTGTEEAAGTAIRNGQERGKGGRGKQGGQQPAAQTAADAKDSVGNHPYKGKHIDISL